MAHQEYLQHIEQRWASEQVRRYVDALIEDIAREFAVPARNMRPEEFSAAMRAAWDRTAVMRAEVVRLTMAYSWPVLILPSGQPPG